MDSFKELVKKNKKRALSLAIASTFMVTAPNILLGCNNSNQNKQKDEEEEQNETSGSATQSSHWTSYGTGKSSESNKSSVTKSSTSKSSGYSGVKGGSSSS